MADLQGDRQEGDDGLPDPSSESTFRAWLKKHPPEWSSVVATRAALRILPKMAEYSDNAIVFLPVFRATAVARFAAEYPNRQFGKAIVPATDAVSHAGGALDVPSAAWGALTTLVRGENDWAGAYTVKHCRWAIGEIAYAIIKEDLEWLLNRSVTPQQLAAAALWSREIPSPLSETWERLKKDLLRLGEHWSVWIDWYSDALWGVARTEAAEAAFTDVTNDYPWTGTLPWNKGAEAVNTEIGRRLELLHLREPRATPVVGDKGLAKLAVLASPQPSITVEGQLHAGPNNPFDAPKITDDLSTLPLRQRNLIKNILDDIPANAPRHLKQFLRAYDDELVARGAQPILGILKDDADIIAAAVAAPGAEDEWLEPGMRKAFDRFAENHLLFVEHFPRDVEREAIYAQTSIDEEKATGTVLQGPLETIAKATEEAHHAGEVTDDFHIAVTKMNELGRVVASLPSESHAPEVTVSPDDRILPVTVKKRTLLRAIGFIKSTLDKVDERNFNLAASGLQIASTLQEPFRQALRLLMRLLT